MPKRRRKSSSKQERKQSQWIEWDSFALGKRAQFAFSFHVVLRSNERVDLGGGNHARSELKAQFPYTAPQAFTTPSFGHIRRTISPRKLINATITMNISSLADEPAIHEGCEALQRHFSRDEWVRRAPLLDAERLNQSSVVVKRILQHYFLEQEGYRITPPRYAGDYTIALTIGKTSSLFREFSLRILAVEHHEFAGGSQIPSKVRFILGVLIIADYPYGQQLWTTPSETHAYLSSMIARRQVEYGPALVFHGNRVESHMFDSARKDGNNLIPFPLVDERKSGELHRFVWAEITDYARIHIIFGHISRVEIRYDDDTAWTCFGKRKDSLFVAPASDSQRESEGDQPEADSPLELRQTHESDTDDEKDKSSPQDVDLNTVLELLATYRRPELEGCHPSTMSEILDTLATYKHKTNDDSPVTPPNATPVRPECSPITPQTDSLPVRPECSPITPEKETCE